MPIFFHDTLSRLSSSILISRLLDIEFARVEGAAGEAIAMHSRHTLRMSRAPSSTMHGVDSDQMKVVEWAQPTAFFFPRGCAVFARIIAPLGYTRISIPDRWFDMVMADSPFQSVEFRHFGARDPVLFAAADLLGEIAFATDPIDDPLLVETLTLRVVYRILLGLSGEQAAKQVAQAPAGLACAKVSLVTAYIDANVDRVIRLTELAAVAGLSLYHFSREFRAATNMTPMHFVMSRRVQRAKELLRKTQMSLVEVALQCGFASQSHFSTVFKQVTGKTPAAFRAGLKAMLAALAARCLAELEPLLALA